MRMYDRLKWLSGPLGYGAAVAILFGCAGSSSKTVAVPPNSTTYVLTVNSTQPASGINVAVNPADVTGSGTGTTSFNRTYASGTQVSVKVPASALGNTFASWTGCPVATASLCTLTVTSNTVLTANYAPPPVPVYTLTVDSTNPASGVAMVVSPADNLGASDGTTFLSRTYNQGTSVSVTAPQTAGISSFTSWSGCSSVLGPACSVVMTSNATVTANYTPNAVTGVSVAPASPMVLIGAEQQFQASVTGSGTFPTTVIWQVTGPAGYSGDVGTIDRSGLYITPFPAPPKVTITATTTQDTTISGRTTVTLVKPATTSGPALTVDPGSPGRAISPLIYGLNGYGLDQATVATANPAVLRWGGDNTSRYNYLTNTTNSAQDYFFENFKGTGHYPLGPTGSFNEMVEAAATAGAQVVGNAPVLGWVSNSDVTASACSFQKAAYPNQKSYHGVCGDGTNLDGTNLSGSGPIALLTSLKQPPPTPPAAGATIANSWIGQWVNSLVARYGAGKPPGSGTGIGVAHWDLDNEPEYWNAVHRDVHPLPMTYDELTQGGIGTALAIKTADPTALVSGPVISAWDNYFYSTKDVYAGYGTGPCYKPWSHPVDRTAHGGVPLIEYYLQQMRAAETAYGMRLLDYLDIHGYFAGSYTGSGVGLTAAGNTAEQKVRLNSTRVLWDPIYTDPNYSYPNYTQDSNYTSGCNPAADPVQLIPRLAAWVARDYPGTKTSIDEYNFGGLESINGAVAEADVLGIFGKFGLDKGILWPTTTYSQQLPGTLALAMYRNYDGAKSTFGETSLVSTSSDQATLAVYAAQRATDGAVTIIVINKTYGDLTSTLSLENLMATGPAEVYQLSSANSSAIVHAPQLAVTLPPSGSSPSLLSTNYPAQSVTLLVVPTR